MDEDCGNESNIRLTSKNQLFYAPIFTFQINYQKTRECNQLLGHPPTMNIRTKTSPALNDWVERCETEHFLRQSSTNYTYKAIMLSVSKKHYALLPYPSECLSTSPLKMVHPPQDIFTHSTQSVCPPSNNFVSP